MPLKADALEENRLTPINHSNPDNVLRDSVEKMYSSKLSSKSNQALINVDSRFNVTITVSVPSHDVKLL